MPYPAPRGVFRVDLRKAPRVPGGPVGFMLLASTSPQYMWDTSTGGVSYVDVSGGGFRVVASLPTPGVKAVRPEALEKVLKKRFTNVGQAEKAVIQELGLDWSRLTTNVYMFVSNDNVLYSTAPGGKIVAYGLIDPTDPSAGIQVLRTFDFTSTLAKVAAGGSAFLQQYGALIVGCNPTYDGKIVVLTNRSVSILDPSFEGEPLTVEFDRDEYITNSMAIDEKGGIYAASDTMMHKVVWTGEKLSADEADGAWSSAYDYGREPPSVKFGKGSGSTPTLMGFGDDPDKLVVITDGADHMKVVGFWRDEIPADFEQRPGAKSRRIAGQIEITCGLSPKPEFIQSEQSAVVNGYGAFVANSIRARGHRDRLVDVIAGGPVFDPPVGCERVEWNPATREWRSVWTRADVIETSMVPSMSSAANIVFVNGYTKKDGWEITGLDWDTGKTVHRTIFGHDNLGNGAYALIQFLPNGDMAFNSIGGTTRVHVSATKH
jgi:hypothetical protein